MTGSPPHLDLFDYKPELVKHDGAGLSGRIPQGQAFRLHLGHAQADGHAAQVYAVRRRTASGCPTRFRTSTRSPTKCVVIHSMNTDQFNHAPAELLVYTGSPRSGRPSMGAWVTYGLGTENENLAGFVVLISSGVQPNGGKNSFGSGFLPSVYQGVQCRSKGDPVLYASDPPGMDREMRRMSLDALRDLNEMQADELGHPETLTRIAQYELAFRMQMSVPEVMDISREPKQALEAYGAQPGASSLANNCLLARRLVEPGVRFVQLFDWGWDFHGTNRRRRPPRRPDQEVRHDGQTDRRADQGPEDSAACSTKR